MKHSKPLTFYHFFFPAMILFLYMRSSGFGDVLYKANGEVFDTNSMPYSAKQFLFNGTSFEIFFIASGMLLISVWTTRGSPWFIRVFVPASWLFIAIVCGSRYIWDL